MMIPAMMRLLVIDQDFQEENFLKQALNSNKYQVMKLFSSNDVLYTAQTWNPDVILINLIQPSSDGWEICQKIRELSQAPILVLAVASDPGSIALWLDAGADDYIIKPFSSNILSAHLKKLSRRYPPN